MKTILFCIALGSLVAFFSPSSVLAAHNMPTGIYKFTVTDIDGNAVHLDKYKGKVLLIVNTASLCGNTPQYAALESLYEKYKGQGFEVLAFPENDFHNQEPGSNSDIKQFCTAKYNVTFPLFSKIDVIGANEAPLYHYLTDAATDPQFAGDIDWNFAKFLISRNGQIVNRFKAGHKPSEPDVIAAIEAELAKPI